MTDKLTATDLTNAPRIYSNEEYDANAQILKVFSAELKDLQGKKTQKAEKRRAELETLTKAARAACDANPQRYSSSYLAAEILASLSGMHSDATARCAATIAEMQTSLLYTLEWRFDDLVNWQTTIKFINWIWAGINNQIKPILEIPWFMYFETHEHTSGNSGGAKSKYMRHSCIQEMGPLDLDQVWAAWAYRTARNCVGAKSWAAKEGGVKTPRNARVRAGCFCAHW